MSFSGCCRTRTCQSNNIRKSNSRKNTRNRRVTTEVKSREITGLFFSSFFFFFRSDHLTQLNEKLRHQLNEQEEKLNTLTRVQTTSVSSFEELKSNLLSRGTFFKNDQVRKERRRRRRRRILLLLLLCES